VALGRAIVREPQCFLFDEPLSNLDAKLRVEMRAEIKRLHLALGSTTVYVTHDQEEAITLGDRVVVMDTASCSSARARSTSTTTPRTGSSPASWERRR
jgi:ABC-type sugar transport system ATPase subunit